MTATDASFWFDGGRDGVLLIHGLTGTPAEMRFVGKELARAGYTVYGMQLDGHCGSEADLLATGWRDWYGSVERAYRRLAHGCDRVFVGGLSMGALLGLHLAAHLPRQAVSGLALYSPTLWYDGWNTNPFRFLLPLVLRLPFGHRFSFREEPPYGIKDERLRQVVVSRMLAGDSAGGGLPVVRGRSISELHRLIRRVKRELHTISTPALVMHAVDDDMTSVQSNADYIENRLGGPVRKILLDDCYHMITVDRQRHEVVSRTVDFFRSAPAPFHLPRPADGEADPSAGFPKPHPAIRRSAG
ncbi:MAG TPA: alpha/beta fold hydrolase [Alphaproteobacteria bacterium]